MILCVLNCKLYYTVQIVNAVKKERKINNRKVQLRKISYNKDPME